MNKDYEYLINKARELSALDDSRLKILELAINNVKELNLVGEIFDLGVYKGGSSLFIKSHLVKNNLNHNLHLFDTFSGIAHKSEFDVHEVGSVCGDSYEDIKYLFKGLSNIYIHEGIIPNTFLKLEDVKIAFAHIDVDNYEAVKSCLEFVYPRAVSGSFIILDDVFCQSCPGAKKAFEEFIKDKPEKTIRGDGEFNPQVYFIKV